VPNQGDALKGLNKDNPIKISGEGKKGRKDEFRRISDRKKQDTGEMQQSSGETALESSTSSPDDVRRRLNARFEVEGEDLQKDSRKLRELTKSNRDRSEGIARTVNRTIDQMVECIHQGKKEDVTRILQNLKGNSPSTYEVSSQTFGVR